MMPASASGAFRNVPDQAGNGEGLVIGSLRSRQVPSAYGDNFGAGCGGALRARLMVAVIDAVVLGLTDEIFAICHRNG
jgi:hypothetical protein